MEPIFEYKRLGFSFTVYPNRIETSSGTMFKKHSSLLMRNVTDVTLTRSGQLEVMTSDGKKHKFIIGLTAPQARQAILEAIP